MRLKPAKKRELTEQIGTQLVRQHSTAAVLFHQAVGERLGLGPADHKCFDLLRERGVITGSELAAITGLTSGAITGVVARLEHEGYLRRESDPSDGRQQILFPILEKTRNVQQVLDPIKKDMTLLLDSFDAHQLAAIAEFLTRNTDSIYRHMALLRAEARSGPAPLPKRSSSLSPAKKEKGLR